MTEDEKNSLKLELRNNPRLTQYIKEVQVEFDKEIELLNKRIIDNEKSLATLSECFKNNQKELDKSKKLNEEYRKLLEPFSNYYISQFDQYSDDYIIHSIAGSIGDARAITVGDVKQARKLFGLLDNPTRIDKIFHSKMVEEVQKKKEKKPKKSKEPEPETENVSN